MTDKFHTISIRQLLQLIFKELEEKESVFGIPKSLFFQHKAQNPYQTEVFNQTIDTPVGVAAGPHTQMAQNIIGAWLMGARYIELKTIQTLDELEIAKPCIDMQDEGYNCEWSQELKIKESFNEYLNAWIAIHLLNHELGFNTQANTIFNMSVGYNLEGILKDNVQWFFRKMDNCSAELKEKIQEIKSGFPQIAGIQIPTCISDNVTLSTMHGCPANEIEDIAKYLLEIKGLHTYVKLNPTLLGAEELRNILNKKCGFKTAVPNEAFEHDLAYSDAINIIKSLQNIATNKGLEFGLKLTNTLESQNHKTVFDKDVDMMYMSGRALHPLSINLTNTLQKEFNGQLQVSFSGGADAFNISEVLSCGYKTVTVCSDLLKPGGYMRLHQYFEVLDKDFEKYNAMDSREFIKNKAGIDDLEQAALKNLIRYANHVLDLKGYKRQYIQEPEIKGSKKLEYFDCIFAPCRENCATNQDIPDYMYYTAQRMYDQAHDVILRTNPFPCTTGMVCDHLCQNKCTRINYDDPLLIREVKRFISSQEGKAPDKLPNNGLKVAIIGAGPSGLSAAYYLTLAGFDVEVFEAKPKAGGMVQYAIPGFRLTDQAIEKDFERITNLGVNISFNTIVDKDKFQSLRSEFNYIFIGAGAQLSTPLNIEGINSSGVIESLEFLFNAKQNRETAIGRHVAIIGGGNTAMDAARIAYRLVGNDGKVTVVYRRTINEMPADQGEIKAVIEEGMEIIELAAPGKVITKNGKVKALLCSKMELKGTDASGRPKPVKIEGSEFEIPCDTIIPAIGQKTNIDFIPSELLKANTVNYKTKLKNIYVGGDALRGASTAINAIADGRKAAQEIMSQAEIDFSISKPQQREETGKNELILKRAQRKYATNVEELPLEERKSFTLVSETLGEDAIVYEAGRCLYCDEMCNICITVCPNFANYSYEAKPVHWDLQKIVRNHEDDFVIEKDQPFDIKQKYQVLNIADFCNECGNCNMFCPTNSAPYKEKPKFWLTLESFNQAEEGYYLSRLKDRNNLIYKHGKQIATLSAFDDQYLYETNHVIARFSRDGFQLLDYSVLTPCAKQIRFHDAAEMSILLEGAEGMVFG